MQGESKIIARRPVGSEFDFQKKTGSKYCSCLDVSRFKINTQKLRIYSTLFKTEHIPDFNEKYYLQFMCRFRSKITLFSRFCWMNTPKNKSIPFIWRDPTIALLSSAHFFLQIVKRLVFFLILAKKLHSIFVDLRSSATRNSIESAKNGFEWITSSFKKCDRVNEKSE